MKWLLARLSEPSTWAGIGALAVSIIPAVQSHDVGAIVGTVAGAVAVAAKG
jgi:hypothetical protein